MVYKFIRYWYKIELNYDGSIFLIVWEVFIIVWAIGRRILGLVIGIFNLKVKENNFYVCIYAFINLIVKW